MKYKRTLIQNYQALFFTTTEQSENAIAIFSYEYIMERNSKLGLQHSCKHEVPTANNISAL